MVDQLFLFEKQAIFAQISKMKMNLRNIILCIGGIIFFNSCATKRNLVYFSNLNDSIAFNQLITNQIEPKIETGDALAIKVTTLNPDINFLFNSGSLPMSNSNNQIGQGSISSNSTNSNIENGYIVDKEGNINFPVLGKFHLEGLTLEEAKTALSRQIGKTAKDPIVNIRILNFKITVIGEVNKSGTFNIPNNKVNVLEALGMAGDMTPFAIRDDVLIIREKDGNRIVQHINLNDKSVFNSQFYYLQQNDIVYVRPENKLKAAQANSSYRLLPILTATISALAIILSRVL